MNGPFAALRWVFLWRDRAVFLEGFGVTIMVSLCALLLALFLGIIFGLFSTSNKKILQGIARVYVEFFQNTPLVVQVFFVYNALPYAGIVLDVFAIGMLCVGVYHGAYVSEVIRAGIQSISRGQMDAARSQGFSYLQAMRWIILPQTVTIVLPPLGNQAVNLIKNTSTLALIAGGDLMYRADSWASNGALSYGPAYLVTAVLYFLLCFPLVSWARRQEERIKNRSARKGPVPAAVEMALPVTALSSGETPGGAA